MNACMCAAAAAPPAAAAAAAAAAAIECVSGGGASVKILQTDLRVANDSPDLLHSDPRRGHEAVVHVHQGLPHYVQPASSVKGRVTGDRSVGCRAPTPIQIHLGRIDTLHADAVHMLITTSACCGSGRLLSETLYSTHARAITAPHPPVPHEEVDVVVDAAAQGVFYRHHRSVRAPLQRQSIDSAGVLTRLYGRRNKLTDTNVPQRMCQHGSGSITARHSLPDMALNCRQLTCDRAWNTSSKLSQGMCSHSGHALSAACVPINGGSV